MNMKKTQKNVKGNLKEVIEPGNTYRTGYFHKFPAFLTHHCDSPDALINKPFVKFPKGFSLLKWMPYPNYTGCVWIQ